MEKPTLFKQKIQTCLKYPIQNHRLKRTRCLTCSAERRRHKSRKNPNAPTLPQTNNVSLDYPALYIYNYSVRAGMAEMADAADLKSAGEILVGSSPSPGTRLS